MKLTNAYNEIKDEIIKLRRKIHQNPELSFREFETAKMVCDFLEKYGISYTSQIAKTGVCALLGKKDSKKVLLLRADMDALELEEKTLLPFASKKAGVMHACGHDLHTAGALAACYILKKYETELGGCVKVIFQPAEETTGGAKPMIDEGVLDNPKVTRCLGAHVSSIYNSGDFYFKSGPLMASPDDFLIEFEGKSAHGAEPDKAINPIDAAVDFASQINKKLCEKIDMGKNVFSICSFNSGNANNVIPDRAMLEGTFRSFDNDDRKCAEDTMTDLAKNVDARHKTKTRVTYNYRYPPLINNPKVCDDVRAFANKAFGENKIKDIEKPLMTGEDFSYFALSVPSAFIWVGSQAEGKPTPLHSSEFIANEDAIETIARLYAGYALEYLK